MSLLFHSCPAAVLRRKSPPSEYSMCHFGSMIPLTKESICHLTSQLSAGEVVAE